MRIGITGQNGFIGRHLYNYLNLQEGVELVEFKKSYFDNSHSMDSFVTKCDCIVHLAAMNRSQVPQKIYNTNISLVNSLLESCIRTDVNPHIVFSSSTQSGADNEYGLSKKEGGEMMYKWAEQNSGIISELIIPNVFGPFGKPMYNSVVATFCHKLVNNDRPELHVDSELKLIYVNKLIEQIYLVTESKKSGKINIEHQYVITVSDLLGKLIMIKTKYFENGEFPSLTDSIDLDLFNTFRCYVKQSYYPRFLKLNTDYRGSFVEVVRANSVGQFSYSTTKPGITRGNHYHTRKAERFAVIKGKARIELRKVDSDEKITYLLDGDTPSYVDMPIWYTHNITNVGNEELVTLFWINEPYDPNDSDTYFVDV